MSESRDFDLKCVNISTGSKFWIWLNIENSTFQIVTGVIQCRWRRCSWCNPTMTHNNPVDWLNCVPATLFCQKTLSNTQCVLLHCMYTSSSCYYWWGENGRSISSHETFPGTLISFCLRLPPLICLKQFVPLGRFDPAAVEEACFQIQSSCFDLFAGDTACVVFLSVIYR